LSEFDLIQIKNLSGVFCLSLIQIKMPKRRRRKKRGSDAWKNIVRLHRRGPKRIKVSVPRRSDDYDPLVESEHSKRIQIILNDGSKNPPKIGVSVFNQAFTDMGLTQYKAYTMVKNRLTRAGHALKKCLELFEHNDFILGGMRELKLDNCVGRCIVMTGKINKPDVQLTINPEKRELSKKVKELFSSKTTYKGEVEYM